MFELRAGTVTRVLSTFPFNTMSNEHGNALKIHISCLIKMLIADAPDGAPKDVKVSQVRRHNFTGMRFIGHERTLRRHRHLPAVLAPRRRARELPGTVFDLLCLYVLLVFVTYEAAEEIKVVLARNKSLGFRW